MTGSDRQMAGCLAGLGLVAALVATPGALAQERVVAREIFVDRAEASGLDFVHFNGMSGELTPVENTGQGAAFVDYDNDGDLDVYFVQGAMLGVDKALDDAVFAPAHPGLPTDRLYRNDSHLGVGGELVVRFVDVTERIGLSATGYGMGVVAADYDNDGWTDLYVTNYGENLLLRNLGDGSFRDATLEAGAGDVRWSAAASFFDFDRDGWLDLFIGNYLEFSSALHSPCTSRGGALAYCAPVSFRPQADRLLRNRGDGTFEDVSAIAGIEAESGRALGSVAADFNLDGWMDLYVANDMSENFLWINNRDGSFENQALLAGCAVDWRGRPEASMGVAAGDIDDDGDEDLLLGHLGEQTNTLYWNDGNGQFRDGTRGSGLGTPSWRHTAFGTVWLDFDNDRDLDLFVANGAVSVLEALQQAGDPYPLDEPNQLFENLGGAGFREISSSAGAALELVEVSRGAALGDVDNDGDGDVLVANNSGPARLLTNELGQRANWIGFRLLSASTGRDLLGARAEMGTGAGSTLSRTIRTDGSFASSSDARAHFGLGDKSRVEGVRLAGPAGRVLELRDLPANRYFMVRMLDAEARRP